MKFKIYYGTLWVVVHRVLFTPSAHSGKKLVTSLVYLLACLESTSFNFAEGYDLLSQNIRIERIPFF